MITHPKSRFYQLGIWLLAWIGLYSIICTSLVGISLLTGQWQTAQAISRWLVPISKGLDKITFEQIPNLVIFDHSLQLLAGLPSPEVLSNLLTPNNPGKSDFSWQQSLSTTSSHLGKIARVAPFSSGKYSILVPVSKIADKISSDWQSLGEILDSGQVLVLLQNTQELRPTGGFIGSYALMNFNNSHLSDLSIHDIYEPDGQWQGWIEPPAGVKEYLSSGKGWRLPDANWSPDFPSSARQIDSYFNQVQATRPDIYLAVNLSWIEELLDILGPLYIPDYQIQVTGENLAEFARLGREEFFPGDHQKTHLLSLIQTQLELKIKTADSNTTKQVIKHFFSGLKIKDVQIWSKHQPLAASLSKYGWDGAINLPTAPTTFWILPIEANVGINKANQEIFRSAQLDINTQEIIWKFRIENQNQSPLKPKTKNSADHLAYVNFQRVWLPAKTQIKSLTINQTPATWTENLGELNGQAYLEVSFLNITLENQTTNIELTVSTLTAPTNLIYLSQSGIPRYAIRVEANSQALHSLASQDQTPLLIQ